MEVAMSVRVHIRWMIRRDMPEVLAIERACFEFPWFEEDFIKCLRNRNCIGMVAERDEQVVAFMIYELHKTRIHVLNLAVATEWQRRGIGRQMADKLKGKLSEQRRTSLTLETRESNVGAQVFFKRCGFWATNILPDFYDDSPEDAYLFEFHREDIDEQTQTRIDNLRDTQAELAKAIVAAAQQKATDPIAHLLRCAKKKSGCRLSADEVQSLVQKLPPPPLNE